MERQQIRLEELKEFNKITKREKKQCKSNTVETQTEAVGVLASGDVELQEETKRNSLDDVKKETVDTPMEDLVIRAFESKDKKDGKDEPSPGDPIQRFKLASQSNPFAFNPSFGNPFQSQVLSQPLVPNSKPSSFMPKHFGFNMLQ